MPQPRVPPQFPQLASPARGGVGDLDGGSLPSCGHHWEVLDSGALS